MAMSDLPLVIHTNTPDVVRQSLTEHYKKRIQVAALDSTEENNIAKLITTEYYQDQALISSFFQKVSLFKKLISSEQQSVFLDADMFILSDRVPKKFEEVLDYMRINNKAIAAISDAMSLQLEEEYPSIFVEEYRLHLEAMVLDRETVNTGLLFFNPTAQSSKLVDYLNLLDNHLIDSGLINWTSGDQDYINMAISRYPEDCLAIKDPSLNYILQLDPPNKTTTCDGIYGSRYDWLEGKLRLASDPHITKVSIKEFFSEVLIMHSVGECKLHAARNPNQFLIDLNLRYSTSKVAKTCKSLLKQTYTDTDDFTLVEAYSLLYLLLKTRGSL